MPSSLIYSILETSSQSHTALSPESALVAWKPRSGWQIILNRSLFEDVEWWKCFIMSYHVFWFRWKQPSGHYRVGRLLSSPMEHIPKSRATSSQTLWKGRRLAPSSLKWNLQVQGTNNWKQNIWPTCVCGTCLMRVLLTPPGPTVEQQTEMARHAGRTLASLHPEQVIFFFLFPH